MPEADSNVNPFPGWLAEVAGDEIVVRPDEPDTEARCNQWGFGLDAEQRAVVTARDVEEFIWAVVKARGRWLAERGLGPMRFYCWPDAQAGQLRFSLVSSGGIRGLFACPVDAVSLLRVVVSDFLIAPSAESLPVWVTTVPERL